LLGAYYRDELIGFAMLGNAGRYGVLEQIISKIMHRDKAPNNARKRLKSANGRVLRTSFTRSGVTAH
jgi:hypothetical protein